MRALCITALDVMVAAYYQSPVGDTSVTIVLNLLDMTCAVTATTTECIRGKPVMAMSPRGDSTSSIDLIMPWWK